MNWSQQLFGAMVLAALCTAGLCTAGLCTHYANVIEIDEDIYLWSNSQGRRKSG